MWGVSVGCMREAKQPLRCRSCKGFCSRYLSSLNTETERQKEPLTMEIKNTNTTKLCLVIVLLNCIVLTKLQIPNNHSPSHSSNYPHFFRIIRIIQVIPSSSSKRFRNNCNQKHPGPTAVTTVCSAGNGLRGRGPNWFTNHLLFTKWFLDLWFEELYSTWQTKQINKSFAIYKMSSWFMIWRAIFNMTDQTD